MASEGWAYEVERSITEAILSPTGVLVLALVLLVWGLWKRLSSR